jgi:hypothetical protein
MENIKLLLATTVVVVAAAAIIVSEAKAQTAPNISTTDAGLSGLNTSAGLQNMPPVAYLKNDGATLLVVKSAATAVTATLVTQAASVQKEGYGSVPLSNQTVSIPANSVVIIGPFPQGRWNNSAGLVQVSMSAVTAISATTLKVPK